MMPPAPEGMPANLVPIYDEAVAVADISPASSCALLRYLIQMLVKRKGMRGAHRGRANYRGGERPDQ